MYEGGTLNQKQLLKNSSLERQAAFFFHYIWENWIECVPNGVNFCVIYLRERKKAGTTMGFTHLQVKLGIERRLHIAKNQVFKVHVLAKYSMSCV